MNSLKQNPPNFLNMENKIFLLSKVRIMLLSGVSQQNSSDIILYVNDLQWHSPTLVSTLSSKWGAVVMTIERSWSRYSFCCNVSRMWSLSACRICIWNNFGIYKSNQIVYCTSLQLYNYSLIKQSIILYKKYKVNMRLQ